MHQPSAVPGCQPQARIAASSPSSSVSRTSPAQRSPALHTTVPAADSLWLPADVIEQLVRALPLQSMLQVSLVSRDWLQGAGAARSCAKVLRWIEELSGPGPAQFTVFEQFFAQIAAFPPQYVVQGLTSLARLQPCLVPECREPAFRSLLGAASGLLPAERCMVLCALAWSLLPAADGSQADWQPGAVDMLIAAARTLPVAPQGMIVAALCGNREDLKGASDRFLGQIAGIVASWPEHELQKPGCLFARKIHECVGPGPITQQMRRRLGHFGYYRLPFMTEVFEGRKTAARITELGREILALDLDMPAKRKILAHHDHQASPWLPLNWLKDAEGTGLAYVQAIQALPLEQEDRVALLSACMVSGAPMLGMLFSVLTNPARHDRLVDITKLYIDEITGSTVLAESGKIVLLRARMTGLPHNKAILRGAMPPSVPRFRLGPEGDMPFSGLSLIDSIFCDATARLLQAYMLTILGSSLSDEAKCAVLRLDYPDRVDQEKMNFAQELYSNALGSSKLPDAMKVALCKDVRTVFDRSCVLM